jgi:hypothetical protein
MEEIKNTRYCSKCLHFDGEKNGCNAFPSGIPTDLLSGKVKHKSKFPEQEGNDVFVDAYQYWTDQGLKLHPMIGVDDAEIED